MYSVSIRVALIGVFAAIFVGQAAAQEWTIARVTGVAWLLQERAEPVQVVAGMQVPLGATVATTPRGRAMLVHGRDTMVLGPSTKIAIPHKPDRGLKTTVIQQVGQVDLAVEKRGRPHFSVQTPFLAAIVKGTEFSVIVSAGGAEVGVKVGLVSVADLATGERADVGSGQRAAVAAGRDAGLQVSGLGAAPQIRAGHPQKAAVAAGLPGTPPGKSGGSQGANGQGAGAEGNGSGSGGGNGNGSGSSTSAGSKGSTGDNSNQGGAGNGSSNSGGSNNGGSKK
jgi:hypothetical protein